MKLFIFPFLIYCDIHFKKDLIDILGLVCENFKEIENNFS